MFEIKKAKWNLNKDKYISLYFDISIPTIIKFKKQRQGLRYKSYKTYFIDNIINRLSDNDIIYYSNNKKTFEDDLKTLDILNKLKYFN